MSREKNLINSTVILSFGTFFPKFITVFLTPILTAQLTKAEYGQYDLITTIVSLLLPVVTLQASSAAFRFLINERNNKEQCKKIISTIFAFVVILSIIACAIYYLLFGRKFENTGLLVSVYFFVDILIITAQESMRGLGKNYLYSISVIIRSTVDVILVAMLLGMFASTNFGITGVLWAMVISTLAGFVFLYCSGKLYQYIDFKSISLQKLKELLSYSWPIVPDRLSNWVLRLSDRLVITAALGIEANAVYAVANRLPIIFSSFLNAFTQAWQENASIAARDNDKDEYYSQMCNWVYRLMIGIMAGLIMLTPIIWKILVKGDYDEAYYQLPILYLGILFLCMSATIGGIYIAHMKTRSIALTTMGAAIINLSIDLLFVNSFGIWAGSVSTMISYLCLLIFRMWDVQRFQKINFNISIIVSGTLFLAFMGYLSFKKNIICDIINVAFCIIVLIIYDKDIISMLITIMIRTCDRK